MKDEYIRKLTKDLPDPCTVNDIIDLKIFSRTSFYREKLKRNFPQGIKINPRKLIYTKQSIIDYLNKNIHMENTGS